MNYQVLRRQVFIYLFWGLLFGNVAPSYAVALINFSLDPASPTIDGNITPDDVLNSVPEVAIQGSSLGLQDDFPNGLFDNLNALSYGRDFIGGPLFFSVDRLAMGSVGSAVKTESLRSEAAGDVYISFPGTGSNQLLIDEEELGLTPGFFGDDVDALAMEDKGNSIFTYFSIDDFSASNFLGAYSSDIILSKDGEKSFSIFADGFFDIGLEDTDDIDALALYDVVNPGTLDPGEDLALFSLSSFSSSLLRGFSPADILFTDFTGDFSRFASAAEIGLDVWDELDALDTVNVPEPLTILGTTRASILF